MHIYSYDILINYCICINLSYNALSGWIYKFFCISYSDIYLMGDMMNCTYNYPCIIFFGQSFCLDVQSISGTISCILYDFPPWNLIIAVLYFCFLNFAGAKFGEKNIESCSIVILLCIRCVVFEVVQWINRMSSIA